jgi:TDG/mug DNA glycosylase family protein
LIAGGRQLEQKVRHYQPQYLAILGIGAYQTAYQRLKARLGRQFESIADTIVWVLPNPSGLNAHYQFQDLVDLFGELRQATLND